MCFSSPVNASAFCDADPDVDDDWVRVRAMLACLENSLHIALPLLPQYLDKHPEVSADDRRVILEAAETVAGEQPLPTSSVHRLMTSIISVGFAELTANNSSLTAQYRNETNVYRRIVLCYGFIAFMIPKAELEHFLVYDILPKMKPFLGSKDPGVRSSVCFSLRLVARAARNAGIDFPYKRTVLEYMTEYIKDQRTDGSSPSVSQKALLTCSFLSEVKPFLKKQQMDLVYLSVGEVLTLPSEAADGTDLEDVYSASAKNLSDLLRATLKQDISPNTLLELLKPLQCLCLSQNGVTRQRAVKMVTALLEAYCAEATSVQVPGSFPVGRLLASLVPQCCDPEAAVRKEAAEAVHALIDIWLRVEGGDFARDELEELIQCIVGSVTISDTCEVLVQIIGGCLPRLQKQTLIECLLWELQKPQRSSAQASCVLLWYLLRSHPTELARMFPQVLHVFLGLGDADESVKYTVWHSVVQLTITDKVSVVKSLLSYTPPADRTIQKQKWHILLLEAVIACSLDPWPLRELIMLASTGQAAAGRAVANVLATDNFLVRNVDFAELIAALLPLLAPESPAPDPDLSVQSAAVEALKAVLSRARLNGVLWQLEQDRVWDLIREPRRMPDGIFLLAWALLRSDARGLPAVVTYLWERHSSMGERQRRCVAAFFDAFSQTPSAF
ncbi:maestro heat-like repeat-containing protein family member 1 [Amia ocellicauda]|uniref:maestro heat-like repeat-containing protein family member 1 n=1 Tax=Amia ocellicauda TaxID=2972642 RepID=UPI00346397C0